jgi:hypothetical protein
MYKALPALAATMLAAVACSSGTTDKSEAPSAKRVSNTGDVGDPCRFGKRPKNVYVAVRHYNGIAYKGDMQPGDLEKIRFRWGSATPRRLRTVVAAPQTDEWRVNVSDNCYDPKRKAYYNCTKTLRADLSKIRSLVRAAEVEPAHKLALAYCRQRVVEAITGQIGEQRYHRSMECRIIASRWCDIPKALRVKVAPKKK